MIKRGKSKKKELLSDKISSLFTVAPSADIEDDQVFGTKPKTVSRNDLDSDEDVNESSLSVFKKRNVALLSELSDKYAGEVTSRKELKQSESDGSDLSEEVNEEESDDEDLSGDDQEVDHDESMEVQSDQSGEEKDSSDEGSSDEEGSEDGFDISQMEDEENEKFTHFKKTDKNEEINKGNCVKNQLSIWENLLEMRISLQKCLITANKMPLPDTFQELKKSEGDKFINNVGQTKGNVAGLLTKLMDLQSQLLGQFSETKNLLNNNSTEDKKKVPEDNNDGGDDEDDDDEEITSDSDSATSEKEVPKENIKRKKRKLGDFSNDIAKRFAVYSKYRNGIIQKWHDKTRLSIAHSKSQQSVSSTLAQIEYLLKDKNRLVKKTQLKRSRYDIVGQIPKDESADNSNGNIIEGEQKTSEEDEDYCPEIFDDDDFYHQLLRELIEHKSADISDPIQLSRQWIALQQMRSKMKRKIDTRATKGRRIRFVVHSKLVNFMAPQKATDWTEDSKNELFASLFGKQYESSIENKKNDKSNDDVDMKIF